MILLCEKVDRISDSSFAELKASSYRFGKDVAIDLALFSLVNRRLDCDMDRLAMDLKALRIWDLPTFPLNGRDLIASGVEPGPHMGKLVRQLEESWIESDFQLSSDDLLSLSRPPI